VSAGATSVSGSDDNSKSLTFSSGELVDVSLNGVSLVAGTDYNTTTSNTIAGLSAMSANDVVEVIVYDTFSTFSGSISGDFAIGGDLTVTGVALARGAVVQRQYVNLTSTTQLGISGNLTEMSTSLRIAFTPKHASSVLYAELSAWFCSPNNNALMYSRIFDVTNSAIASEPPSDGSRLRVHWSARKTKFDSNDFDYMHYIIPISASNTNARTYTPYFGSEAGGGTVEFLSSTLSSTSGVNSPITFSITEIYNP
tara:strand:- start:1232 stop:1993 length:762 start_codon:yes stop_codon:yes gene_type:complete